MPIIKRLYITASNNYDSNYQIVPVNTEQPLEIDSKLTFKLFLNIKNFDGSKPHLSNSLYNLQDDVYLNGEKIEFNKPPKDDDEPNLRINIEFTPKEDINGSNFAFGNDFTYPIRDYVPVGLLNTGLKLFNWFINDSVKGDPYPDKPYLYGPGISSFTYMAIKNPDDPTVNTHSKSSREFIPTGREYTKRTKFKKEIFSNKKSVKSSLSKRCDVYFTV